LDERKPTIKGDVEMKSQTTVVVVASVVLVALAIDAFGHPGSGIVVDDADNVFFTYTGQGAAKIDRGGKLTIVYDNRGGHWMCIDKAGVFANSQPKFFRRVTPDGVIPAIIYADGGAPLAVSSDGHLYYGAGHSGSETGPGGATVARLKPGASPDLFAPSLKAALAKVDEGVTGLALARDGTLLVASASSIWKLYKDGGLAPVARPVILPQAEGQVPSDAKLRLRGLGEANDGTVYVAATGHRCVLKIAPDGRVDIALRSQAPWTPTGVAVHQEDLLVLEYTNANDGPQAGWRPRVRRLSEGRITTLFEARENMRIRP
jgi:ribosomal protein L25 (general stress protein Ctc)